MVQNIETKTALQSVARQTTTDGKTGVQEKKQPDAPTPKLARIVADATDQRYATKYVL
jgi:hypothetical protein